MAKNKGKSGKSVLYALVAAAGIMGVTAFGNTVYAASEGIHFGEGAESLDKYSIALGEKSYVGDGSDNIIMQGIAIGYKARVENDAYNGIAIGGSANVKNKYTMAIGHGATAENNHAIAIGSDSKSTDRFGISIGSEAEATGLSAIAVVPGAKSAGETSFAAGTKAEAAGLSSVAVGSKAISTGAHATAFGSTAEAAGENSAAFGAAAQSAGGHSVAVGSFAQSSGDKSVAVGGKATAAKEQALALGYYAEALSQYSTAAGVSSVADGESSIAVGAFSKAKSNNAIAIGRSAAAKSEKNIALGYYSEADGDATIAIGSDAFATGGQSIAIGDGSRATFNHAGYHNGSVVLGYKSSSNAWGSVVIGDNSHITGDSDKDPLINQHGIAIGYNTKVTNTQSTVAIGDSIAITNSVNGVTAVGSNITVGKNAKLSTVLGFDAKITVEALESVAVGRDARANAAYSVVLGSNSRVNESFGIALGYSANANVRSSVAIGPFSVADTKAGEIGYDILLDGARKLDDNVVDSVWKSTRAAVSIGDIDNNLTRQITNVAAGTQDTDAVNVAQLKQVRELLTNNVPQVPQYEAGEGITITPNGDNKFIISSNIKASGDLDFKGDAGETAKPQDKVDAGGQPTGDKEMTIVGGITNENSLTENNIGVVAKDDKLVVKLGKDLKNLDSIQVNNEIKVGDKVNIGGDNITVGDVKITDEKITTGKVEISKNGINAGDEKITNVDNGEVSADSKDAVNGSQLYAVDQKVDNISQSVDNLNGRVNRLDSRINKVGAGAAALAALHPLDFDPDEKLTFSAGMGNYRGENAAALGMFYRPDEKTMFSLGGTVGNGENMVNVGVSFALDRTSNVNNSKVAMAKDIVALRTQVAQLTALVNHMALAKGMESEIHKIFPDVPENHWAYEYVDGLAAQGVIEGYPDGSFGGNRLMTRYEFAAMLYRAMEKGAQLDGRIIKEFETELGRVRVDRISGEDNDEDKVERVRVNVGEDKDDYGSKIILADE